MKHMERCSKRRLFAPELWFRPDGFRSAWLRNSAITLKCGTGICNLSFTHAPCAIAGWCVWVRLRYQKHVWKSVKHVYCTFSIMLLISANFSGRVPRTLSALHVWNYQCGAWKGRMCEYHTVVGFNRQLTFFNEPFSIMQQQSEPVRAVCVVSVSAHARADITGSAVCVCFAVAHSQPLFSMWRWAALLFY